MQATRVSSIGISLNIPFNKPYLTGHEIQYICEAHKLGGLAGDGKFTKDCHAWIEKEIQTGYALLTHSCTAALEMMAMLIDLQPGDEVIMPSYTFVSTANAFALRGAVPVFVDIRSDTLNIDETIIESAITSRTKAIVPVHYAGVACEMDAIQSIAEAYDLPILEDAAQGIKSTYKGKPLGSIGQLGALSFHETKNVIAGEGGALLINDPQYIQKAEIIREKGTNRSQFFRGEIDKYSWVEIGSSYLPGEITAAFLLAQLQKAAKITAKRIALWDYYYECFAELEHNEFVSRPNVPVNCQHNGHMFYLLIRDVEIRTELIKFLASREIHVVFHYVPLHSSHRGSQVGRAVGELKVTNEVANRLVRLPLFYELTTEEQAKVVQACYDFFSALK